MPRGSPSAWSSNIIASSISADPQFADRRRPRVPAVALAALRAAREVTQRYYDNHINKVRRDYDIDRDRRSTYSTIPSLNKPSRNQNSSLGRSATHGRKMRG